MVKIEIHENAKENFDKRSSDIRGSVQKSIRAESVHRGNEDPQEQSERGSDYHPHISATISDEDIVGNIISRLVTDQGAIHGLDLIGEKATYSLNHENACAELTKLLDAVLRTSDIGSFVTRKFLENSFITWCSEESTAGFVSFLTAQIEESVKKYEILVPMYQVMLQSPVGFEIEACSLTPLSNSQVASITNHMAESNAKDRIKSNIQGTSVVICSITAESDRAISLALDKANYVASVLAFYSQYTMLPDKRFNGMPVGSEYDPHYEVLIKESGQELYNSSSGTIPISDRPYIVDADTIKYMDDCRAKELVGLLARVSLTPFEEKVRTAVRIFVKSAFTTSNTEKLIFGVVAIETMFLGSETESIVDNVSRRIAFFLATDLEGRKDIIAKVKSAYTLRSKYMHHGQTTEDKELLMSFQQLVFCSLVQMLGILTEYEDKNALIRDLEDAILS